MAAAHDRGGWRERKLEPLAAVILSLAAVLMAWSAFQGTTWAGEAATQGRIAGAARTESAKDLSRFNQDLISDQVLFTSYVVAVGAGDETAAEVIATEFRPEFAELVEEWIAAGPGAQSPFDSERYSVLDEIAAAVANTDEAQAAAALASEATEQRNDYAAATVILALTLFVVGIGMTFDLRSIQLASLVVGGLLLIIGFVWIITFPIVV